MDSLARSLIKYADNRVVKKKTFCRPTDMELRLSNKGRVQFRDDMA